MLEIDLGHYIFININQHSLTNYVDRIKFKSILSECVASGEAPDTIMYPEQDELEK